MDCTFKLTDAGEQVFIDGKLLTLSAVVAQKRAISPLSVSICYHEIKESPKPDDASWFTLEQKHTVFFQVADLPSKKEARGQDDNITLPVMHLAGTIDSASWATTASRIIWAVKWTARGLQAVRPIVALVQEVRLPPQSAVELLKA